MVIPTGQLALKALVVPHNNEVRANISVVGQVVIEWHHETCDTFMHPTDGEESSEQLSRKGNKEWKQR